MITVPDRDALTATILANLKSSRTSIDTSKGSPEWARVNAVVEAIYGIHWNVRAVQQTIWPGPDTPTADLESHADLRIEEDARRGPVESSGTDALTVTGTLAGAAVTAGLALVHSDGTRIQLTEGATIGVGTADLSVEAITKGIIGNKLTGDTFTFESPPANIQAEATLAADLTGGLDQETNAELLERVIQAYRNPPAGGRFADYWKWALAVDGVASAYVYGPSSYALEGRRGLGIVDVAILIPGTGAARAAGAAIVQDVQDMIDANRPVHAKASTVFTVDIRAEDIDVQLTPAEGYEWDWTGSGVVQSYAAKVITWTGALPETLTAAVDAGESPRIFVAGQVFTVASYVGVTTTINETPTTDPANPDPIYPGGPLSAGALAAVKTYCDSLGPSRETYADPSQRWDDTLRPTRIAQALIETKTSNGTVVGIEGCREATVITPPANMVPTDDVAGNPELIVYGVITIRPVP
jgi:hypothetical protein